MIKGSAATDGIDPAIIEAIADTPEEAESIIQRAKAMAALDRMRGESCPPR